MASRHEPRAAPPMKSFLLAAALVVAASPAMAEFSCLRRVTVLTEIIEGDLVSAEIDAAQAADGRGAPLSHEMEIKLVRGLQGVARATMAQCAAELGQ